MVYLIVEILWFLCAAAAIGFVVGWLCRSAAMARRRETAALQQRSAQSDLEARREQLEARLAETANANEALQEEIAQLRQTAEADAKARRKLEREQSATLVKLEAREREMARLAAERQTEQAAASLGTAGSDLERPGRQPVSGSFVRQK